MRFVPFLRAAGMKKQMFVDWKWTRIGNELRTCDPERFAAVLDAAERIVDAYREAGMWAPAQVTARNDNRK